MTIASPQSATPLQALIVDHLAAQGAGAQAALKDATGITSRQLIDIQSGHQKTVMLDLGVKIARHLQVPTEALVGAKPIAAPVLALPAPAGGDHIVVPLSALAASPHNARKTFNAEALQQLAASIKEHGLLESPVIRQRRDQLTQALIPGEYQVIAGERRYRALHILADAGDLPPNFPVDCRLKDVDDAVARAIGLIENLQREDLPPLEEGEAFKDLVGLGWKVAEIADRIHKSERYVQERIQLARNLAPEVKAAMEQGKIGIKDAMHFARAAQVDQKKVLEKSYQFPGVASERLSGQLTSTWIPTARAIFDRALYEGEIAVEKDPNAYLGQKAKDVEFFCDAPQFRRLQKEAVAKLVKELEVDGWSWVARAALFHAHQYKEKKLTARKDRDRAGVLIVMGADQKVEIHKGLVKKPAGKANQHGRSGGRGPTETAEQKAEREKKEAARQKIADDQDKLTGAAMAKLEESLIAKPDLAIRFVAFELRDRFGGAQLKINGKTPPQLRWQDMAKLTHSQLAAILIDAAISFEIIGTHGREWTGKGYKPALRPVDTHIREIAKTLKVELPGHLKFKKADR